MPIEIQSRPLPSGIGASLEHRQFSVPRNICAAAQQRSAQMVNNDCRVRVQAIGQSHWY